MTSSKRRGLSVAACLVLLTGSCLQATEPRLDSDLDPQFAWLTELEAERTDP